MNFKHIAALTVLATAAGAASASTEEMRTINWGDHLVTQVGSNSIDSPYLSFDDTYTFNLTQATSLGEYAFTVDIDKITNLSNTVLTLYDSSNTAIDSLPFDGLAGAHANFGTHAAGSYYYEVTGDLIAPADNGSYTFVSNALVSPVPEPGSAALLMAGLGLMGFIARRRKS